MIEILQLFIQSLWLAVPAVFANATPQILARIHFLDSLAKPIDLGKMWRGKPIFGSHKTFRGFIFGILISIIAVYIQRYFYNFPHIQSISLINYSKTSPLFLGSLVGFGVLFGDLVKSFVKRRFNKKPGEKWFPWDILDATIGGLVFLSFIYIPPVNVIITLLLLGPCIHILSNLIGYTLGIKKVWW